MLLTIVDQCTTTNIRTAKIFKKKTLNSYQSPVNGITSQNYQLTRLHEGYYGNITYSPTLKKFFIFGHPSIMALDQHGNEILHLNNNIKDCYPIRLVPYVVTPTHIYDLTLYSLKPIPFKIIWKKDFPNLKDWKKMYSEHYKQATVVVYSEQGRDFNNKIVDRAFLKINEDWLCFTLPSRISLKNDYFTLRTTTKQFPVKGERLLFLKDTNNKQVSDYSKSSIMNREFVLTFNRKRSLNFQN